MVAITATNLRLFLRHNLPKTPVVRDVLLLSNLLRQTLQILLPPLFSIGLLRLMFLIMKMISRRTLHVLLLLMGSVALESVYEDAA